MRTSEYLDLAIKKAGVKNDNQLSVALGWTSSKVCNYRKNRQAMDNEAARQIAELLEVPVWQIIADMEIQRAKDEPTRKAWKVLAKLSKQSGRATANLLFPLAFISAVVQVCILCKIGHGKNRLLETVSANCA